MGLFGADDFLRILCDYRVCWIGGRYSGGKTSLAFWLAHELISGGYGFERVFSNCRSVWDDSFDFDPSVCRMPGVLDAVVVIDEGGQKFFSSRQFLDTCDYAAKMNVIWLLPSYSPPPARACPVVAQPIWRGHRLGAPLVIYKWSIHLLNFRDNGWFLWFFPELIYGIYDRQDTGRGLDRVRAIIGAASKSLSERGDGDACDDVQVQGMDEAARRNVQSSEVFADAASELSESLITWSSVSRKGRRR